MSRPFGIFLNHSHLTGISSIAWHKISSKMMFTYGQYCWLVEERNPTSFFLCLFACFVGLDNFEFHQLGRCLRRPEVHKGRRA